MPHSPASAFLAAANDVQTILHDACAEVDEVSQAWPLYDARFRQQSVLTRVNHEVRHAHDASGLAQNEHVVT